MSFSTLSLISEGIDCPNMDRLFIITPIKHSGRLEKVVGWVLKQDEGKQPMAFDYTDHHIIPLTNQAIGRQKIYSTI